MLIAPYDPKPRVGLANACALIFESTRIDITPDVDTLQEALRSGTLTCELDPMLRERGWALLAFVLHRCGHAPDAIAAARKAIELRGPLPRRSIRVPVRVGRPGFHGGCPARGWVCGPCLGFGCLGRRPPPRRAARSRLPRCAWLWWPGKPIKSESSKTIAIRRAAAPP